MNSSAEVRNERGAVVVPAAGELPVFHIGDKVLVDVRAPVGHYRVPLYLRGKVGRVEAVIRPRLVDNEAEGFGRNTGSRLHYYRLAFPIRDIWPAYAGPRCDGLRIEVSENWLERI
jgi:nitrile hydratase subunit beta